jgi:hypothetical protein
MPWCSKGKRQRCSACSPPAHPPHFHPPPLSAGAVPRPCCFPASTRARTRAGLLSIAFMLADCLKLHRPAAPVAERCSTGASLAMKRSGILQGSGALLTQQGPHWRNASIGNMRKSGKQGALPFRRRRGAIILICFLPVLLQDFRIRRSAPTGAVVGRSKELDLSFYAFFI